MTVSRRGSHDAHGSTLFALSKCTGAGAQLHPWLWAAADLKRKCGDYLSGRRAGRAVVAPFFQLSRPSLIVDIRRQLRQLLSDHLALSQPWRLSSGAETTG